MPIEISSQLLALFESKERISLVIVSVSMLNSESLVAYSSKDLIVKKRAAIHDTSTFFSENAIEQVCFV